VVVVELSPPDPAVLESPPVSPPVSLAEQAHIVQANEAAQIG
jgi:hypothetical protein